MFPFSFIATLNCAPEATISVLALENFLGGEPPNPPTMELGPCFSSILSRPRQSFQ